MTGRPCLTASLRANCMSPSRPLISLAIRLEVVTYLKEGMPIAARIADDHHDDDQLGHREAGVIAFGTSHSWAAS